LGTKVIIPEMPVKKECGGVEKEREEESVSVEKKTSCGIAKPGGGRWEKNRG